MRKPIMAKFNKEQIHEIIPHRYEMSLLDEIENMEEGKIRARITLSKDDWFFRGHFPNEAVMPGVLQVEALAQAGAVYLLSIEEYKGRTAYFAGLDRIKFKRKVVPGEVLDLIVEITKLRDMGARGAMGSGVGVASVNGEIATQCELSFFIGPAEVKK